MDKYKQPQAQAQPQPKELGDFKRRKPPPLPMEEDGRRTPTSKKMRKDKDRERERESNNNNNNDSSGTNSNSTSGSSHALPFAGQAQRQGSARRSRSPRPGLDSHTPKIQKTLSFSSGRALAPTPNFPPPRGKVVNWRLACFMAREYLSRGTLLGKAWPPQDSNTYSSATAKSKPPAPASAPPPPPPHPPSSAPCFDKIGDDDPALDKEKERLYSILTDFIRSDDVHIPGVVNPSQLAAWMGFK